MRLCVLTSSTGFLGVLQPSPTGGPVLVPWEDQARSRAAVAKARRRLSGQGLDIESWRIRADWAVERPANALRDQSDAVVGPELRHVPRMLITDTRSLDQS